MRFDWFEKQISKSFLNYDAILTTAIIMKTLVYLFFISNVGFFI